MRDERERERERAGGRQVSEIYLCTSGAYRVEGLHADKLPKPDTPGESWTLQHPPGKNKHSSVCEGTSTLCTGFGRPPPSIPRLFDQ